MRSISLRTWDMSAHSQGRLGSMISALHPPRLRHRKPAGGIFNDLSGPEQSFLIKRLADELQPKRRPFRRETRRNGHTR